MVIDYVTGNRDVRETINGLQIEDKVDSDHHLIEVKIKGKAGERRKDSNENQWRGVWIEKGYKRFQRKVGNVRWGEGR